MKNVFIMLALLLTVVTASAQTERRIYTSSERQAMQSRAEKSEPTKEQKKLIEAMQDSICYALAIQALETLDFVIEADQLIYKHGQTAHVTSNTNFISLSDDKVVVQIAPFNSGGPNGVGGITLDGTASNIRVKTSKKGNMTVSMNVSGNGLSATIDIQIYKGSNRVSVTVNPNLHSNRISLSGEMLPTALSTVYKGISF